MLSCKHHRIEIDERTKKLITIADQTKLEVGAWLELVKLTPVEEGVADLILTIQDVTEDCQRAAFYKIKAIEREEITSFRSGTSRKSSKMTSASSTSCRSSKETLINVKAKRAALEQKIKFSEAINEQQKVLNKLKLQQELSETIAEETVREEALQMDELPFEHDDIGLPKETQEQLIDRFMNNTEVPPTHQTTINNFLQPVIDTSFVDIQKQSFPSLYSPTGIIHPVNNQAEKREPKMNKANSLQKTIPEHQSPIDLGIMGHQPNFNPLADGLANPFNYEDFPKASQPPAALANVGFSSTPPHSTSRTVTLLFQNH